MNSIEVEVLESLSKFRQAIVELGVTLNRTQLVEGGKCNSGVDFLYLNSTLSVMFYVEFGRANLHSLTFDINSTTGCWQIDCCFGVAGKYGTTPIWNHMRSSDSLVRLMEDSTAIVSEQVAQLQSTTEHAVEMFVRGDWFRQGTK